MLTCCQHKPDVLFYTTASGNLTFGWRHCAILISIQDQRTLAGDMLPAHPPLISSTKDLWLEQAGTRKVLAPITCAYHLIQSTSQALETQVVRTFTAQSTVMRTRSTQTSVTSSSATFRVHCVEYKCVPPPSWCPPTTLVLVAGLVSTTDFWWQHTIHILKHTISAWIERWKHFLDMLAIKEEICCIVQQLSVAMV